MFSCDKPKFKSTSPESVSCKAKRMREKMIMVVDIETSGPNIISNAILAIGYCIGDMFGSVIEKRRINVAMEDDHEFDSDCVKTFWSRGDMPTILSNLQRNAISPKNAIQEFIGDVDRFDRVYDLTIASDNPAFDFTFVAYYLNKYLSRKPLHYRFGTQHRFLTDLRSFSSGFRHGSQSKGPVWRGAPGVKYDHYPENDAEVLYLRHCNLLLHRGH